MTKPQDSSLSPARTQARPHLYRDAAVTWAGLFVLACVNGAARDLVLVPRFGAIALPLSGVMLMLVLLAAAAVFVRYEVGLRAAHAWRVGLFWLALTLMAEAVLVVATGRPLRVVAEAFTPEALAAGNLFAPAVIVLAVAPALWTRIMGRPSSG